MKYIREHYGVPAKRGARVLYRKGHNQEGIGTITSARGARIMIRMDGQNRSGPYHPTWEMEYLEVMA